MKNFIEIRSEIREEIEYPLYKNDKPQSKLGLPIPIPISIKISRKIVDFFI